MRDQQTEAQGAEKDKAVDTTPAIDAGEEAKTHYHAQGTIPPVGSAEPPAPAASASDLAFGDTTGGGGRAAAGAAGSGGGGGQPLPDDLRAKFEASLGADLSNVRIHTDGAADAQTKAHGAKATATGQDIHMAPGKYDPHSSEGQELLAHEVAHTVQQKHATPMTQAKKAEAVPSPSSGAEREADGAASAMMAGDKATVTPVAEQAPHAKADDLATTYRESLNNRNWTDVALELNGFSDSDLKQRVGKLTAGQQAHVRAAAEVAMPGWSQRVTGAIDALKDADVARIATLYAAFERALAAARTSGDWTEVANRLNGMGDWDIHDRLRKLTPSDLDGLRATNQPRIVAAIAAREAQPKADGHGIDAPMVAGTFLGQGIQAHPILVKRLQLAESHLQATVGKSGAELAKELGVHGGYSIFRKGAAYHGFGLAIDINYSTNPFIGGQDGKENQTGNQQAIAAIFHACLLTGQGTPVSPSDSASQQAKQSTADLWQHFHDSSEALKQYLGAKDNLAQVNAWIQAGNLTRALAAPRGVTDEAKLRGADAPAWLEQIRIDQELTHGASSSQSNWWMDSSNRATTGFMDLDQRLVVALRDIGGLGWGASDFGEASGDFMHFDCRHDYPIKLLGNMLPNG